MTSKVFLNTSCDENLSKSVEISEVMSKTCYIRCGDSIAVNYVTAVYKCRKASDHIPEDMPANHCYVDLPHNKYKWTKWSQRTRTWPSLMLLSHPLSTVWNLGHLESDESLDTLEQPIFYLKSTIINYFMLNTLHTPPINVLNDIECMGFPVLKNQVFLNPWHEMVFENTFDKLVEYVGCDQFMNISPWKAMGKQLRRQLLWDHINRKWLTMTSDQSPYLSQMIPWSNFSKRKFVFS